jgi:glycine cleavage system aminomethyltransferase T
LAKSPNVFSHCARSPWYSCSVNENAFYGEYAGRIVLLSVGNDSVEEYWKLRRSVGLFDVPERPVEIKGSDAVPFLNRVFTRGVEKMRVGRGSYGLLCHQRGGMVCDGILFKLADDHYWYVHADADVYSWLVAQALDFKVDIRDPGSWVLQVQGPDALTVLENACDESPPDEFRYFDVFQGSMGGQRVLISRTGWSAEVGFEVYNMESDVDGPALWDHLMQAGAEFDMPACGQLSMNIRRIEAGILNYRTDMDWNTTPYDMGLGFFVDLDNHDFIGREALSKSNQEIRFSGFKCQQGNPRYGSNLVHNGQVVGRVTAYEESPYLEHGVGFAIFDSPETLQQSGLAVLDRDGKECPIELVELPFYDAEKRIPRGLPDADGAVS